MYAVVQVGNVQYKVAEGDVIDTDRVKGEAGSEIVLDKVLLFAQGTDIRVGQPFLNDVKVSATIQAHPKAPKVVAFKFRRRKDWSVKTGHRRKLTRLNVTKISA
jgi:large subunit ribosomal protein L21